MSAIIINEFVFTKQHTNLVQLAVAIEDIGVRVLRIFDGLPENQREELEEKFDDVLMGVYGTCHCLGIVAHTEAGNAEKWAYWAKKTKTNTQDEFTYRDL